MCIFNLLLRLLLHLGISLQRRHATSPFATPRNSLSPPAHITAILFLVKERGCHLPTRTSQPDEFAGASSLVATSFPQTDKTGSRMMLERLRIPRRLLLTLIPPSCSTINLWRRDKSIALVKLIFIPMFF